MSQSSVQNQDVYLPPYSLLSHCIQISGDGQVVTMRRDIFQALIGQILSTSLFDVNWYSSAYEDVADALNTGKIYDPLLHFIGSGYYEGRLPRMFSVDEDWYLARYPDVAQAVTSGAVASAHTHFNTTGYFEGRAPGPALVGIVERWNHIIGQYKRL